MDIMFDLDLKITIRPIWHRDPPLVRVSCFSQSREIVLDRTVTTAYHAKACGQQKLMIEFLNKNDSDIDIDRGLDKAVMIQSISFFGITDPRFIWAGRYRPQYPEPWASQQRAQGLDLDPVLTNVDRMGWNGCWWLDFDLPIFTWIHNLQNLGWIYR